MRHGEGEASILIVISNFDLPLAKIKKTASWLFADEETARETLKLQLLQPNTAGEIDRGNPVHTTLVFNGRKCH